MKRHWARLLWVTITNVPIFAFSIYTLIGVHQEEIRNSIDNPPPPRLWTVFYDNPHFALALVLTGAGLLFEAINRREAGLINCSFWLALCIYAVALGWPALSIVVVVGLFAVDVIWYLLPPKRKVPGLDNSG